MTLSSPIALAFIFTGGRKLRLAGSPDPSENKQHGHGDSRKDYKDRRRATTALKSPLKNLPTALSVEENAAATSSQ